MQESVSKTIGGLRVTILWSIATTTLIQGPFSFSRSGVESSGNFMSKGLRPCNEKKRFHGADRYCTLGEAGNTTFCGRHNCKLCESITTGFGPYLEMKRRTG